MKNSNINVRPAGSASTEFPWKWELSELDKRPKNGCSVFSCFSCGGGSSMGYKLAGYSVLGNCEIDPEMMTVYKANNHPKHSYLMDIRDFVKLPDEEIPEELKHLDILDGSPPCSVFSMAGSREDGWNVEKTFREGQAKHGFNIHGVVFDELHTQPNRKLFDVMTKGSGDARMQPLYFLITTAGTDTKSICYETHQKAKDILAGRKIDPTFYPIIYGADETDDWTDPEVWKKANPSLGITVGIDKVKAACESAKQNPGEENAFRQLRLNQWVKQSIRWMPLEKWDRCALAINEDDLEGRVCYPFTGMIVCAKCGKHYRRKTTASGIVWICATYNVYGKEKCASKQIPETKLEEITADVDLGSVEKIIADDGNRLLICFKDGTEVERIWKDRSRSESWTDEMRKAAGKRAKERSKQ